MSLGYQPLKFQQFDGRGNSKQHITHFVETCENAGSSGDQLVKQLIQSLKGNAFEWYTDLEPEVINMWEQLEKEFLNHLYSTICTVNMMKLTNTRQQKGELVIDYINRWRTLSLDYKDRLTKLSTVEICTQDMHWKLIYILQIELDIDEVAQTNHVVVEMTLSVPPLTQFYDQRKSLIKFGTSKHIVVKFQQRIVTLDSQNKEEHVKDDGE
ncbi:ty3-gypsy retrotransposon protein [Cucumis melo var. makuwa]|uniref:Ty3-gypsy retrotransposon protein n=1 Tax=Cucumis melo var. makuwa TaxID=1194695 RepID=A0A5A7VJK5_CUCMM|nr:ty3-gypsy retrotransposon protein [Cucumis melo var. makuwa]